MPEAAPHLRVSPQLACMYSVYQSMHTPAASLSVMLSSMSSMTHTFRRVANLMTAFYVLVCLRLPQVSAALPECLC